VPLIDLHAQRQRLGERVDKAIAAVLEHGQFIMGPEVRAFEEELAAFCGVPHAVGCGSGTDALLLVLMAYGVGPGQHVAVPSFTFAATAEVVALLGATPVFVDSRPDTYNIDVDNLAAAAADFGDSLVGVIAVDLFGQLADYDAVASLAADHGMWVLGDAAQSLGGEFRGRRAGAATEAAATSFFPAKPLGCYGDGGAVMTTDRDLAGKLRSLRVHGQGSNKYDNVAIGLNARLDTIQAAVLREKLAIFEDELDARQRVADRYDAMLPAFVTRPSVIDGARSAWAQYTVRLPNRTEVVDRLSSKGIGTAVYYPKPLHRQPAYQSFPRSTAGLETAELLAEQVLSLPMHPYLSEDAQDRVIAALSEVAD
jgi:dTDP-4-amino-4,6-dideoxygalactose transaminase